jgi:pimeloyl-ACP methyl ester carboxylesterase
MPVAVRDGVNLVYEESGSGDPALLFVHGWCCNRSFFRPQVAHFATSHRVVAFDQRGHGESSVPDNGYTIAGLADDAAWLCTELSIENPVVVGHSMGAAVAFEMASRPNAGLRAVAAIDPAIFQLEPESLAAGRRLAEQLEQERGNDVRRAFVNAYMFIDDDDVVAKARIVDAMASIPQHVATSAWRGLCDWVPDDALRSELPALIVWAERPPVDPILPARLCPQLVTEQTMGAGHFNQLLAADQVNAALERFLASLS